MPVRLSAFEGQVYFLLVSGHVIHFNLLSGIA